MTEWSGPGDDSLHMSVEKVMTEERSDRLALHVVPSCDEERGVQISVPFDTKRMCFCWAVYELYE